MPVEVEWAMDGVGIKMLQARPLNMEPAQVPDKSWEKHPGLRGHPGGMGWATGRACVINCECELSRVAFNVRPVQTCRIPEGVAHRLDWRRTKLWRKALGRLIYGPVQLLDKFAGWTPLTDAKTCFHFEHDAKTAKSFLIINIDGDSAQFGKVLIVHLRYPPDSHRYAIIESLPSEMNTLKSALQFWSFMVEYKRRIEW